jgi:hypothetical protein
MPGDAQREDVASLFSSRVLSEAFYGHNGTLGGRYDFPYGDLRGVSGEHVPSAGSTPASEQTCPEEFVEDLFEISLGNLLSSGDVFDLSRLAAAVISHVE